MRIALRAELAERIIAERYTGMSKPLSKTTSVRFPHDVQFWMTSPKLERAESDRKFAAVPYYLELASHCPESLPANSFPAVFDFADGQRRYPDKGLIKTLLHTRLVAGRMFGNELLFLLTDAGLGTFLQGKS